MLTRKLQKFVGQVFAALHIKYIATANAIFTASAGTADILLSLKTGIKSSFFMKVIVPVRSAIASQINPEFPIVNFKNY